MKDTITKAIAKAIAEFFGPTLPEDDVRIDYIASNYAEDLMRYIRQSGAINPEDAKKLLVEEKGTNNDNE